MSRLPSTSRRSGKNKLNRHLDHRRKTRVQLIRQHKSCNLSLPSAQVANELPGGLPERFHWPFLGSAQHHATNVSPSVCRSDPPAEPFVRVYDPWHELKFFLLLLPRNCWLTSHQVQAASTSTCSIFISKKKQTNCGQNKPIMILSLSYTTHLEIPTQTNGGCFFRAWSRHPRPSRTDWIGHWAEHCVPSFSSNPQVKSSA